MLAKDTAYGERIRLDPHSVGEWLSRLRALIRPGLYITNSKISVKQYFDKNVVWTRNYEELFVLDWVNEWVGDRAATQTICASNPCVRSSVTIVMTFEVNLPLRVSHRLRCFARPIASCWQTFNGVKLVEFLSPHLSRTSLCASDRNE